MSKASLNNTSVRLFLAIELDPSVRQSVGTVIQWLKQQGLSARWVAQENLHVTLKFLGAVDSQKVSILCRTLREELCSIASFPIVLHDFGFFPHFRRPRVIWIGLDEGKEALRDVFERIETCLKPLGYPKEDKAFHPHVTLGRFRSGGRYNLSKILLTDATKNVCFSVQQECRGVSLLKSVLTSDGAVYTLIERFDFLKGSL